MDPAVLMEALAMSVRVLIELDSLGEGLRICAAEKLIWQGIRCTVG